MCIYWKEFGLVLIVAWTVWAAVVALVLCRSATSPVPKDHELRIFFQNLKTRQVLFRKFAGGFLLELG